MCWIIHSYCRFVEEGMPPGLDDYNQLDLRKVLVVLGPLKPRGYTFDVCFILGMRRRAHDATWAGLMLELWLLYVHLTRGRRRVYYLGEYLRNGNVLPDRNDFPGLAYDAGLDVITHVQKTKINFHPSTC